MGNLPRAMNDRDEWLEKIKELGASDTRLYIYIYIYIRDYPRKYKYNVIRVIIHFSIYIYIYINCSYMHV